MNQQQKELIGIILHMLKDIYSTTYDLEKALKINSVHILSRNFDPCMEMLNALDIPDDKMDYLFQVIRLYVDDKMTLPELLGEFDQIMPASKGIG